MSPARSRRTPIPHRRSRAEIVRAAGVAAGIVVVTAALVWLLRPGASGSLGTGGLMSRQPRVAGLVAAALVVAGIVTWWTLRVSRKARGHERVVVPIELGVVLVAAIVVGVTWPGGLLRHYFSIPKPITPTTTPSTLPTSTTGATGATGATSSSTTPTTGISTTTIP
jgi:F0F1-type ATP synthase assembly protein I